MEMRAVKRRRWNALKAMVLAALALTLGGCVASYVLAWRGYDPAADVSIELVRTFGAAVVAYALKTLGDHMSMNKHGIREVDE